MRVLVVEDDRHVARPLCAALRDHGWDVVWVAAGEEALRPHDADIVLLDLRLPDMDGIEVCRKLRQSSAVPIIVITARVSERDMLQVFGAGANDYVRKPFAVREVIERIKVAIGHTRKTLPPRLDRPKEVTLDRLVIDIAQREVRVDGALVTLTRTEFDILARLAREPGAVVASRALIGDVWQGQGGTNKALAVHVANLRRKLGSAVDVQAVHGVGYRLVSG